eukprot:365411-Chlamydomonas_euryale.AAC.3
MRQPVSFTPTMQRRHFKCPLACPSEPPSMPTFYSRARKWHGARVGARGWRDTAALTAAQSPAVATTATAAAAAPRERRRTGSGRRAK